MVGDATNILQTVKMSAIDQLTAIIPQGLESAHKYVESEVAENECTDGGFDYGQGSKGGFFEHKRRCVAPDIDACKQRIPRWSPYVTSVEHASGTSVDDAKIQCTWSDIPASVVDDTSVEQYLSLDSVDREAQLSDDLQARVCLRPTTDGCFMDPVTKEPMELCAEMHSFRDPDLASKCQVWWARVKRDGRSDEFIESMACPSKTVRESMGLSRLPDDCKCYRANLDEKYQFWTRQYDAPAQCWYPYCRLENEDTFFQRSTTEPCDTIIQECDNVVVFGDNVSIDADATLLINQFNECVIEATKTQTGGDGDTDDDGTDNNDNADDDEKNSVKRDVTETTTSTVTPDPSDQGFQWWHGLLIAVGVCVVFFLIVAVTSSSE